jgi:hypothetical protein
MKNAQETIAFVKYSLDDLDSGTARKVTQRIVKAWIDSDYAAVAAYGDWCDCLGTNLGREMMQRLLDDRNPGLANVIDAIHAGGGKVFAAVGTLHMVGPMGLPALMEQRGYVVEQVLPGTTTPVNPQASVSP